MGHGSVSDFRGYAPMPGMYSVFHTALPDQLSVTSRNEASKFVNSEHSWSNATGENTA